MIKQLHPRKYIWLFVIYSFGYSLSYIKSNKREHDITPLVSSRNDLALCDCRVDHVIQNLRDFSEIESGECSCGITGTTE